MIIGVPKEIKLQEHRIGLTPNSVKELTNNRCFAVRVEVFEHEKNSAIYEDKYNVMSWANQQHAEYNKG